MALGVDELRELGFTGQKTKRIDGVKKLTDEFKSFIREQTAASPDYRRKDIQFKTRELRVINAIENAYNKNDVRHIITKDKFNKIGSFKATDYPIISAMKKDPEKLKSISAQTGIAENDLLNLLEDRDVFIKNKYNDVRNLSVAERTKPKKKFYASAEKWILRNSKRYADPDKFYNAFIRTFGEDNHFIKSIKSGKKTGFKVAFSNEFVENVLGLKSQTSVNPKQLKDIFKTSIYTNNPNVKQKIVDTLTDIIPTNIKFAKDYDVRNALLENPLLKRFGLNQSIKGPIAKLLADDLIDITLKDISSFRKPFLGTRQLLSYLSNRVDPKYQSMFKEATQAVIYAQNNQWKDAKASLNLSQKIMFDHKIPQALIKLGYADDLDYIKLTPTSEDFNTKVKLKQFDQPMITLANEFSKPTTSLDRKAEIVQQMKILQTNFNSKYGNYLGSIDINYDNKTGKLKLTNVDPVVTKKTDFVSSLGKSLVQEGVLSKKQQANFLKKMGFKCRFEGSKGGLGRCDDPANYVEDINKTRQNLKSDDVRVRAAANAKLNKGLQIAKTLPQIGTFLRRVGQATVGGVAKALQATGIGTPVGIAIEGIVEGGVYDYFKGQGYTDQQALSETFFPGMVSGRPEGVPWYGGSEQLLEKELTKGQPRVAQYVDALKDQERVFDAFGRKEQGLQARRKDITDMASADIQDLNRSGTISRINRIMNPESMASRAYQTAVEKQAGRQDQRARDYKDRFYVQREPSEFMQNQLQKERNKAMLEMFPPPTVEGVQNLFEAYGEEDRLKDFEAQDYKNVMSVLDDLQKQDYFADNFRLEKARGGIAGLSGGDKSGPPPVRGPNPQGLLSLKNRVRNL
jgi:hypothetical protein